MKRRENCSEANIVGAWFMVLPLRSAHTSDSIHLKERRFSKGKNITGDTKGGRHTMGDKGGKKGKDKDQKQKAIKHEKDLKDKKDKQPKRALK
jgi:hypothetical protein